MGLDMYIRKYDKNDNQIEVIEWRKEFELDDWFINNTETHVDDAESATFESVLNKDDLLKLFDFIKNMEEDENFTKFNKIHWLRVIRKEIELDEFTKYDYYYESNW